MKKSKIFYIVLVQIILALFFSCKNAPVNEEVSTVAKIRFSLNCRTIEPTPHAQNMTDFVLKAKLSSSSDLPATLAEYEDYNALMDSELEIQVGTYDFILTAKIGGSSFEGKLENHIIVAGNNILSFAVGFVSNEISTGKGAVSVSFTLPQDAAVESVKAWLEDMESGTLVTGSEKKTVLTDNHYLYSVENVPVGDWRLKVTFYCDSEYSNENYTYPSVVRVAADVESTDEIVLQKLNSTYTIAYVLNGGSWVNNYSPVETFARFGTALPDASNIKKGWQKFEGWYTTSTFEDGTKITSISGTNPADITLYAKWFNGTVIMPEQLDSLDLTGETGTFYLTFSGATSSTLSTLASKIKAIPSTGAKIYLSFENSNGLTSIAASTFSGCTKLESIKIPSDVTSIGNFAFKDCTGLKIITIEDGTDELTLGYNYYNSSTVGAGLFYDCPVEELYIGRNYSLGNNTGSSYGYSPFARNQSDNITVTIGENVTSLPNFMFYSSSGVTSVTIDEDAQIMSIGTYVFYGCSELTNLTIPEDVVSIGAYAFKDCAKLEAITIPASVTSIGMLAFDNCTRLKTVTIEDGTEELTLGYNHYIGSGTGEGLFYDCPIEELYIGRNYSLGNNTGNNYGYSPFARNQSDNITVTIGENVTSLPNYIFYSSSGITSVTIDEDAQITSIGTYAFYSCSKLTNLTIPDDVTSIGTYAFSNCAKLEAITIPASVTSIGMLAFDNCTRLKTVTIEDGTEVLTLGYNKYTSNSNNIGEGLFYDCPIESLYLGRNYTIGNNTGINYGYSPFARNQSTNMVVVIGENVTAIPAYLLYQSTGVTSVTIDHDAQITSIGDHAFYGCSKLASFMIPNSVNSIGFGAFYDCSSLAEIKIPANVESIGNAVFFGCTALKKIRIENGQKTLELGYNTYSSSGTGRGLFYDCPIEELYIGRNYTIGNTGINYGYSPFARNQSTNMVVTIGRNVTAIPDYLLYNSSGVTSVTIDHDAQITSIGGRAFYGCSNLASFVIPDSVTIMNFGVFYDCSSLAEITIPANVEDIKNGVFTGCTGLKKVIIEDGEKTLSLGYKATSNTGLGYGLFYDCPIEELYIGRNYSLGTNTGSNYGYSPFGRITATSSSSNMAVTISTSVTSIANYLFYNSSKLNSLSYAGTSAQWNALTKGTNWKNGITATKVTCTDGDVNLE